MIVKGEHAIKEEIRLPEGSHDLEVRGEGAILRATPDFEGRAMLSCTNCRNVRITGIRFIGNRDTLTRPSGLPPYNLTFAAAIRRHGLLIERSAGVQADGLRFEQIAGMAILVTRSTNVRNEGNFLIDCGSANAKGRNNTTGGILLEDGTTDFVVRGNTLRRITGNGIWTHSRYDSARNARGRIVENSFEEIGRDALQAGHATGITIARNHGTRIGYPLETVDVEGGGTPVAIDTAGNVDNAIYAENRFSEINGKCIDLDGFHDGEVRGNTCLNRGPAEAYPFGHFAVVMNNTNAEMQSRNIRITGNVLDGTKFGGIFVIGSGHLIAHNWLRRINLAGCNDTHAQFGCLSFAGEPDILRSGIYFGKGAERPAPAKNNTVIDNFLQGQKLVCFGAAPLVSLKEQRIEYNTCLP